jgi:uncharacterized protein (DUF2236 family)
LQPAELRWRVAREISGIRDIAAELVLVAAGGRAILLQLANPAVGRGVAEHSDFALRPLDRLTGTLTFVYTVVYGTRAEVAYVRKKVNLAHAPVHASATANATAYDAYDAQLQLWVAATLCESAVTMYQRIFGDFDSTTAELVYQHYAALGTSLQVPAGMWPADRSAFNEYWAAEQRTLRVDDVTRAVAHELLHPKNAPLWLNALMPLARLVTTGLLSKELREQFRLPWSPRHQRRFDRWMRMTAAVFPRLPAAFRHSLCIHYLRKLRSEMRSNGAAG